MTIKANLIINPINPLLFIVKLLPLLSYDPLRELLPNEMDLRLGKSSVNHSINHYY